MKQHSKYFRLSASWQFFSVAFIMEILEVKSMASLSTSSNNSNDDGTLSESALIALGSVGAFSGTIGLLVHFYIIFCYLYQRSESFTASQSLIVSLSVFDAFLMFTYILISLALTTIFSACDLFQYVVENAYFVTFHVLVYILSLYLAVNRYCILLAPVRIYLALFARKITQIFFVSLSLASLVLITLLVSLRVDVVGLCSWKKITAVTGGVVGGVCLPIMSIMYYLITVGFRRNIKYEEAACDESRPRFTTSISTETFLLGSDDHDNIVNKQKKDAIGGILHLNLAINDSPFSMFSCSTRMSLLQQHSRRRSLICPKCHYSQTEFLVSCPRMNLVGYHNAPYKMRVSE